MSLIITQHGRRRLTERLKQIRQYDHEDICLQAWSSKAYSHTLRLLREQNLHYPVRYKYRLFQETVFVFRQQGQDLTLVTCFRHQSPDDTQLFQDFKAWLRR